MFNVCEGEKMIARSRGARFGADLWLMLRLLVRGMLAIPLAMLVAVTGAAAMLAILAYEQTKQIGDDE